MNPANDTLEPSAACVALVERSEGLRLNAYWDVSGWACGYGHHGPDVQDGTVWTSEQAQAVLESDLALVGAEIKALVEVPLTQGQFDALVDFTFELGAGRLQRSSLLRLLNAGDQDGAGRQLLAWDVVDGQANPGIEARREAELVLWNS
ncbi:MAG: lysozyme [Terracidiphilus sp.]|jgi:lysozyme